ncbi:MAG: GerW family sporulation protein [Bacteroidota bacterium]
MEINVEALLDKVSEHVKAMAKTETILGEEFTLGAYTVRPVIKLGTGFGSGTGSESSHKMGKSQSSGGAGAGIGICPVGFLVAKGEEISFIPSDRKTGLSALVEKIPDLVEKIAEMKNREEKKEADKKEEKAQKPI